MNMLEELKIENENNKIEKSSFFKYYENENYKLNISYITIIDSNGIKSHFINFPYPVREKSIAYQDFELNPQFLDFIESYDKYFFDFIHYLICIGSYCPALVNYGSRDKIWKEMWEVMKELKIVEMKILDEKNV